MTKEEKLIVLIAQLSQKQHQEPTLPVSAAQVITAMGVTPASFWNMFNGMARANFLRKDKEERVWVTPHGMELVNRLKEGS